MYSSGRCQPDKRRGRGNGISAAEDRSCTLFEQVHGSPTPVQPSSRCTPTRTRRTSGASPTPSERRRPDWALTAELHRHIVHMTTLFTSFIRANSTRPGEPIVTRHERILVFVAFPQGDAGRAASRSSDAFFSTAFCGRTLASFGLALFIASTSASEASHTPPSSTPSTASRCSHSSGTSS